VCTWNVTFIVQYGYIIFWVLLHKLGLLLVLFVVHRNVAVVVWFLVTHRGVTMKYLKNTAIEKCLSTSGSRIAAGRNFQLALPYFI